MKQGTTSRRVVIASHRCCCTKLPYDVQLLSVQHHTRKRPTSPSHLTPPMVSPALQLRLVGSKKWSHYNFCCCYWRLKQASKLVNNWRLVLQSSAMRLPLILLLTPCQARNPQLENSELAVVFSHSRVLLSGIPFWPPGPLDHNTVSVDQVQEYLGIWVTIPS